MRLAALELSIILLWLQISDVEVLIPGSVCAGGCWFVCLWSTVGIVIQYVTLVIIVRYNTRTMASKYSTLIVRSYYSQRLKKRHFSGCLRPKKT